MTLAEFLLARIAELETAARRQAEMDSRHHRQPEDWARYIVDPVIGPYGGQAQLRNVATGLYVAECSDPARVLAECEAKRRIVEQRNRIDRSHGDDEWHMGYSDANYAALSALAAPYADHPDYDDESWRP